MMRRFRAYSLAVTGRPAFLVMVITGLACLAAPSHLSAQSADLVLCDRVAADPTDPDKPADVKGVPDVAPADIATAIKFCKISAGASRRAMYQLGRAYAAKGQLPEAIGAWRKAADKGSSSAMVELGVLYGIGKGVAKDEAQARKLFERAAEAGNPRAPILSSVDNAWLATGLRPGTLTAIRQIDPGEARSAFEAKRSFAAVHSEQLARAFRCRRIVDLRAWSELELLRRKSKRVDQ